MEHHTLFVKVLGKSPRIKVLDFLMQHKEFDYSLTDIAKNSSVGWNTLHTFWKELERYELVKKTRKVGNANMFKLNTDNKVVLRLLELEKVICEHHSDFMAISKYKLHLEIGRKSSAD